MFPCFHVTYSLSEHVFENVARHFGPWNLPPQLPPRQQPPSAALVAPPIGPWPTTDSKVRMICVLAICFQQSQFKLDTIKLNHWILIHFSTNIGPITL